MSELDLDKKVVIKNLCEWDLYFKRIEGNGEIKLTKKGIYRLTRAEIQAQVYANNSMFVGTDGQGSHAKIYVDDKDTRVLLGFESEDGKDKQNIITAERIKEIFGYKTQKTFEKHIEEEIKLDSEKMLLMEEAKRQKLNDHDKIQFIEEYTGYKFKDTKKK